MLYMHIGGAMLLDFVIGDPRWYPHPVRFIGWLCTAAETRFRSLPAQIPMMMRGAFASLAVILATVVCTLALLFLCGAVHWSGSTLCGVFLLYVSLSTGDLIAHSNNVRHALAADELENARALVARMVGRDTENLDEGGIVRACVESVAENLVDGTTAVLFWAFAAGLLGPLLGFTPVSGAALGAVTYKAINTLDSMYGYKNERYEQFGWFAARLDDLANFLPARISGVCVIVSSYLLGYDGRGAARVWLADRQKSSSPNSGHTEAAVAGALRLELGGAASYFGQEVSKPVIGKSLGSPGLRDIGRVNRLALVSSLLFYAACCMCYLPLRNLMV